MRTVNISDLKAQLSAHIQFVRDGEEVLVCGRNEPVARIVPRDMREHTRARAKAGCAWGAYSPLEEASPSHVLAETARECFRRGHAAVMARRTREPLARVPAFWDTSALVPLCVYQSMTPRAMVLHKSHTVVVWWATPVEIASALRGLAACNKLTPAISPRPESCQGISDRSVPLPCRRRPLCQYP
jgi:prevent-host-death family protein